MWNESGGSEVNMWTVQGEMCKVVSDELVCVWLRLCEVGVVGRDVVRVGGV